MGIKDRLLLLSKHYKLSVREFEKACGLNRGNVSGASDAIGADKLSKIIDTHPNVNLYWLLTGNGEMILEKNGYPNGYPNGYLSPNVTEKNADIINKPEPTTIYKRDPRDVEIIELLRSKVELLEDKVAARDEKIAALKGGDEYLEYGVVNIGTSDPAAAIPMPIMPQRNGDKITH